MEVIILHFCRCVSLSARSEAGNWRQDESTESVRSLILSADNTQLCFLFRSTQDRNNTQRNALKMKKVIITRLREIPHMQAIPQNIIGGEWVTARRYQPLWRTGEISGQSDHFSGRRSRRIRGLSETHLAECWCKHIFFNVDTIHNLVFEWF